MAAAKEADMEQAPPWRHHVTRESGVSTVGLSGELDLACTTAVQKLLFEQAEAVEVRDVRVDLAEVGFIDSSALGTLISALHHAQQQGRGFAVINPSPIARRVLTMTGLDAVLLRF